MNKLKLLFLLTILFAVCAFKCGKNTPVPEANTVQYTPQGARIESSSNVSAETLAAVDSSLSTLFADAAALGYTNVVRHADYAIYINQQCTQRPSGVMAWLARADNYDGTEYDQDPRTGIGMVYRAEEVVKVNGDIVPRYIICLDTLPNMANTARFGAEHILAWNNDRAFFYRTETHVASGHPIIPSANGKAARAEYDETLK